MAISNLNLQKSYPNLVSSPSPLQRANRDKSYLKSVLSEGAGAAQKRPTKSFQGLSEWAFRSGKKRLKFYP